MTRKNFSTSVLLTALLLAVFLLTAQRTHASLMHPDVMGDTVWFRNIVEDADPDSLLPLYGEPTAQGDSLSFPVTGVGNFSATSLNGAGTNSIDGTLSLMIIAKQGHFIEHLFFTESGLATLFKPPGSDDDPFAAVTGLFEIEIVGVDSNPITPIQLPGLPMTYSPSNGDFQHSVDNDVLNVDNSIPGPLFSAGWAGSLDVNLTDELIERQIEFWEGVTKINITLDNKLLAFTGLLGSEAFIDKKNFDIFVETERDVKIPEPATLVLALFGLTACVVCGKKTRVPALVQAK